MARERKCEVCGLRQLYISWSALRTHEECKQKAKLLREKKKNPSQDIRGFFHGTVVDRVMRDWLTNDPYSNPGLMPDMVEDILNREELEAIATGDGVVRWRTPKDKSETIVWCRDLVTKLEPILEEKVLPYEYQPARRFAEAIEIPSIDGRDSRLIYLAGEIDLQVKSETKSPEGLDVFSVYDLKGTADDNYWRKTVGQLVFYDLSVLAGFGTPTETTGLIQPMCKRPYVPYQVTDEMREALMARITRMAHDIWRGEQEPRKDSKYCYNCPVRHACPKFDAANALNKDARITLLDMMKRQQETKALNSLIGD